MARAPRWWPIAAMVLGLVAVNVASNRLIPKAGYVWFAVASSAALLAFARLVDHRSWEELGLARADLGRGLRWAGALTGLVAVVYLVGIVVPGTRELFRDERVQGWDLRRTLGSVFVRVPFGTVLLEEVAFRSVVPAVVAARSTWRWGVAVSSVLFGLWHVLPSLGLDQVNAVTRDTLGSQPTWVTVLSAVASTTAVGVWFCWLRRRSGSLLAPMGLHWATNALGYLFAYWAWTW